MPRQFPVALQKLDRLPRCDVLQLLCSTGVFLVSSVCAGHVLADPLHFIARQNTIDE